MQEERVVRNLVHLQIVYTEAVVRGITEVAAEAGKTKVKDIREKVEAAQQGISEVEVGDTKEAMEVVADIGGREG